MSSEPRSPDRARDPVRRRLAAALAVLATLLLSMPGAGTAHAHTGFSSSTPSNGAVVDAPVGLVTIVFTGEAEPVGEGFVARDADGNLQQPVSVTTLDGTLFNVTFDPPLAGGQIGIRWTVKAPDAHPIEGAFTFTVTAPATTTIPATTAPAVLAADDAPAEPAPAQAAPSLEEFLTVDQSVPGETTATIGRLIGFLGVALAVGGLAFTATALRGTRTEIRQALTAIGVLGGVIVVGAVVEYVGVTRIANGSLGSAWSTSSGFATLLRLVGGVGIIVGVMAARSTAPRWDLRPSGARALSAAVIARAPGRPATNGDHRVVRWRPDATSRFAGVGVLLLIVSFWFDGHTVSKGIRPLHALVNSVHVAAGSVWVGGVVAMSAVVWMRHRAGRPTRTAELVVRFSAVATVALAAVVTAGGIMAVLVLDSFGELTGTQWGKMLLLKTGAVGLAMIGGAYNHFRLLPALEADPDSPTLQAELRSTVTAEAIMLLFVVTVTAWLVSAAS